MTNSLLKNLDFLLRKSSAFVFGLLKRRVRVASNCLGIENQALMNWLLKVLFVFPLWTGDGQAGAGARCIKNPNRPPEFVLLNGCA